MIPPRRFPPGVIQLYEINGSEKKLLHELPTSSMNRDRINKMRNDILMVHPTKQLTISENNAIQ